jgi:hypothetical protein
MTNRIALVGLIGLLLGAATAQAQDASMPGMKMGSAASHAASMTGMMGAPGLVPFDIMVGQAGQWMFGYQFMVESMDGMLDGTDAVSAASVLEHYQTAPTDMTMKMHMAMLMYAPTDKLTLMAMVPYADMSMGELRRDGTKATEKSEGIGDVEIRTLYSLYATGDLSRRVLLNVGVGLPTGSIERRDAEGARMEYPMQPGSGSYSVLPGITYLGQAVPWGWAADLYATVYLDQNDIGYRLGNRYESSVTVAREFSNGLSVSTGARGEAWDNIQGMDPLLDPADEPTKDTHLQGGRRVSALLGFTFHPHGSLLEGQHLHILGEVPVVQSLDGPQLKRNSVVRIGWQLEF